MYVMAPASKGSKDVLTQKLSFVLSCVGLDKGRSACLFCCTQNLGHKSPGFKNIVGELKPHNYLGHQLIVQSATESLGRKAGEARTFKSTLVYQGI